MADHPALVEDYPWVPDQKDGTYRNPIIDADYSDPDVIRVAGQALRDGDDFYLTASSFNCTPGLPILHSRDLVNWTIVNYAIDNVPGERYREVLHGCGVWAPAMRFHGGKFYIFFPTPDEGIYVVTADDPRGKWSPPHLVQAGKGLIDPCPLWDDDGVDGRPDTKAYLVHAYARSRAGFADRLRVAPMAPDASKLIGEGKIVYNDPKKHPTLEGPKFHKRNGYYYISAPAGGVGSGWQVILRSKDVYGPYEEKIVLAQGGTPINGPHQGALVDAAGTSVDTAGAGGASAGTGGASAAGETWFVHFQEDLPYGRITHLQPVKWENDWPMIGVNQNGNGVGEPVLRYAKPKVSSAAAIAIPQTSDEFDSAAMGLQWQWHANHEASWSSLSARPGWLRLFARRVAGGDFAKTPTLLLQKLPARRFSVETRVELTPRTDAERAGLIMMGLEHAAISIQRAGGEFEILHTVNGKDTLLAHCRRGAAEFAIDLNADATCVLRYRADDAAWQSTGGAFAVKPGRWIGAKVGLFAITPEEGEAGYADFDYFRFSPLVTRNNAAP